MSSTISMHTAKRRLATVWYLGCLVPFLVLVGQSLLGKYGDDIGEAWNWLLPTIIPTLSLVTGVMILDAKQHTDDQKIKSTMFRFAFALSVAYVGLVTLQLFVEPFSPYSPLRLMALSHFWLAPVQGLAAGALGVFFVDGERTT